MIALDVIKLDNGRNILLEAIDARTVSIKTNAPISNVSINYSMRSIIELNICDKLHIKLDEPRRSILAFKITEDFSSTFDIKYLQRVDDLVFIGNTMRRNNSNYFITPLLNKDRDWIGWNWSYVNTFILKIRKGEEGDDYLTQIGILCRFYPTELFNGLSYKLEAHKYYAGSFRFDNHHIMFKFDVPKESLEDFNIILESRYSEISDKAKQKILKFHNFSEDGDMAKILNKDKAYREQLELKLHAPIKENLELFSAINHAQEIITL